jgi:hypothetical protein
MAGIDAQHAVAGIAVRLLAAELFACERLDERPTAVVLHQAVECNSSSHDGPVTMQSELRLVRAGIVLDQSPIAHAKRHIATTAGKGLRWGNVRPRTVSR